MKIQLLKLKGFVAAFSLFFPLQIAKPTVLEKPHFDEKEVYCLTKNIYHEARGEPKKGKIAVAQVTLNRVKHKTLWPNTVCGVVYQKIRGTPQFSWTNLKYRVTDSKAWQEAQEVAYGVMYGHLEIRNFTYTYFHNRTIEFGQRKPNHKIIGNHVFY